MVWYLGSYLSREFPDHHSKITLLDFVFSRRQPGTDCWVNIISFTICRAHELWRNLKSPSPIPTSVPAHDVLRGAWSSIILL